jgi:tetratricopeptide (TPR) repeat protein
MCAAVTLGATAARADSVDEEAASHRAQAAAISKDALVQVKKGQFEAARRLYEKAFEIFPSTPILFNFALAELRSGHVLEALGHFRAYLKAPDADAREASVVNSDLLPRAYGATGHIDVGKAPRAAELAIDGHRMVPTDDGVIDVSVGTHEVVATTGTESWRGTITLAAGERSSPPLELIATKAETVVPVPSPAPVPGAPVAVPLMEEKPVHAPYWTSKRTTTATMLGIALASEAVSLGFFIDEQSARSKGDSLGASSSACDVAPPPASIASQCTDYRSARDREHRDAALFDGLLIGGAALTVASFIVWELWSDGSKAPTVAAGSVSVRPILDPVSGRGGIVGTF